MYAFIAAGSKKPVEEFTSVRRTDLPHQRDTVMVCLPFENIFIASGMVFLLRYADTSWRKGLLHFSNSLEHTLGLKLNFQ